MKGPIETERCSIENSSLKRFQPQKKSVVEENWYR